MRALLAVLLLAFPTCTPSDAADPVAAYKDFVRAVQKGEQKQAFAALSQPTQELLKKRTQEISQASSGAIKNDPAALFFGGAPPGPEVTEVRLVQQDGQRAKVSAKAGERTQEVTLLREAEGWKVDLTDTLQR